MLTACPNLNTKGLIWEFGRLHQRSLFESGPEGSGFVSGFRVSGLGFRGLGFRGLGFRGLGFRGLGFRVEAFGFRSVHGRLEESASEPCNKLQLASTPHAHLGYPKP